MGLGEPTRLDGRGDSSHCTSCRPRAGSQCIAARRYSDDLLLGLHSVRYDPLAATHGALIIFTHDHPKVMKLAVDAQADPEMMTLWFPTLFRTYLVLEHGPKCVVGLESRSATSDRAHTKHRVVAVEHKSVDLFLVAIQVDNPQVEFTHSPHRIFAPFHGAPKGDRIVRQISRNSGVFEKLSDLLERLRRREVGGEVVGWVDHAIEHEISEVTAARKQAKPLPCS
jgi:hypothetical protein